MDEQIAITKIGLVTLGENKGKTKLTLSNEQVIYVEDPKELKVGDPVPIEFIVTEEDPTEKYLKLRSEIISIISSSEKASQNNALEVLKSSISKLKYAINYQGE